MCFVPKSYFLSFKPNRDLIFFFEKIIEKEKSCWTTPCLMGFELFEHLKSLVISHLRQFFMRQNIGK